MELLARIEALLRRSATRPNQGILQFGSIRLDLRGTTVTRDGKPVYLSAREFHLLRYLAEHSGITLSRAELLREVWGYEIDTFTRTVDVHIASLRKNWRILPRTPS